MASLINDAKYLDRPEQWDELADRIRRAGIIGLDTEFYGVDVRKQSCVGRAKVHVWSVAIRTKRMDPLGFHRARGWVLPVEALLHTPLRAVLEDAEVDKCVHNQPVDDHAMANHGVELRGAINTLDLYRWSHPHLKDFDLKSLMKSELHREPVCEFLDVVRYRTTQRIVKTKTIEVTQCACGVEGCRLRKARELPDGTTVSHVKTKIVGDITEVKE